jgi:hypothetical protein
MFESGNFKKAEDFSKRIYGKTAQMMVEAVNSFRDDQGFIKFLTMVYDFLANGNN